MAQDESKSVDLNVQIIQAVEYCPLLYKGRATIEERQTVWQQLSQQLHVPESVLKSRWHILCGYYQRCLEKRRSTDEEENGDDANPARSDFRYEKEMAFMMPYMHARIAIAAANAARKQQELAAAGNKELTDPEFIITEKDLENATRLNSHLSEEYIFYDVETLDGEVENGTTQSQQYEHQHINDVNDGVHIVAAEEEVDEEAHEQQLQQIAAQNMQEEMNEEVIEEVDDESGNIVVQDLIIEGGGELVSEDGEQIVVEEDEILQMDDQIETVIEEVVEENAAAPSLEDLQESTHTTHSPHVAQTVIIQSNGAARIVRVPTSASSGGHKYAKIMHDATATAEEEQHNHNKHHQHQQELQQQQIVQPTANFAQEYAVMTRRRRAVVIKATPRVQVELTDNAAAAAANVTNSLEIREDIEGAALDVAAHAVVDCENCGEAEAIVSTPTIIANTKHHSNIDKSNARARQKPQPPTANSHERLDSSSDHDNRSNDSNVVTTSTTAAESEEDHHTPKGERSEDTIFGELVTAMLRHMPQDRKRAIKKSIMDLLLT